MLQIRGQVVELPVQSLFKLILVSGFLFRFVNLGHQGYNLGADVKQCKRVNGLVGHALFFLELVSQVTVATLRTL